MIINYLSFFLAQRNFSFLGKLPVIAIAIDFDVDVAVD